jgi:2-polyprenyl-3-methyl-5-hydroxy-6-metoxy-1,4-benzoquinol methylase
MIEKLKTGWKLISRGDYASFLELLIYGKIYRGYYNFLFFFVKNRSGSVAPDLKVITEHRVAFDSPDHMAPCGTKENNSTNRSFVLLMNKILRREFPNSQLKFLDLGCSGGQLVKDFRDLGYVSAGLEGSDYSLKHGRANWPLLANKNLFTCDISKPFEIKSREKGVKFNLITIWEVLEHIRIEELDTVFKNIINHLEKGGYFIASTSSSSAMSNGLELHQTRMSNQEWHKYIQERFKELAPVDLGLKYYQYVRFRYITLHGENSFLVYRKN